MNDNTSIKIARLITLEKKFRTSENLSELGFVCANELRSVVDYNFLFFLTKSNIKKKPITKPINSLCFIKKKLPKENDLGKRHVVGNDALVVPDRKKYHDTEVQILDQKNNPWSNTETLPEEELAILKKK